MPGTIPAAPAVGAATMMPMREFSSSTAIEYAMHFATRRPPAMSPSRVKSMTFFASPPTSPEKDLPPASPRRTESFMIAQRSRNVWKMRSRRELPLGRLLGEEDLVERTPGGRGGLRADRQSCSGAMGSPGNSYVISAPPATRSSTWTR